MLYYSLSFIATLIYGSVVFHRERKKRSRIITHAEDGLTTAIPEHTETTPIQYAIEGAVGPFFESGGTPVDKTVPELGGRHVERKTLSELPTVEVAQELAGWHHA